MELSVCPLCKDNKELKSSILNCKNEVIGICGDCFILIQQLVRRSDIKTMLELRQHGYSAREVLDPVYGYHERKLLLASSTEFDRLVAEYRDQDDGL